MALKVKILGAGSIGNHLANAARRLNWSVDLCDADQEALARTKLRLYPQRYGQWDDEIGLFLSDQAPRGDYDLICIGTPPDTHMELALEAVREKPQAILIEKPLCGPDLRGAQELSDRAIEAGVAVFVGYDHVVGEATVMADDILRSGKLGAPITLDVEFREHWGGIFRAHSWLAGPWETYLGFSLRGGGASGEHSHAANLWQHFANSLGAGRVVEVQAMLSIERDNRVDYDKLCLMNFRTENGLVGRCIQDVVTQPERKWARIQCASGFVEWQYGFAAGKDRVAGRAPDSGAFDYQLTKTRPDDFINELKHIEQAMHSDATESPIALVQGLNTMLVIAAAHAAHRSGRSVTIDYNRGYVLDALSIA